MWIGRYDRLRTRTLVFRTDTFGAAYRRTPAKSTKIKRNPLHSKGPRVAPAGEVEGPVLLVHGVRDALVEERERPPHDRDVDRQVRPVEDEDLGIQDRHVRRSVPADPGEVNETQADSPAFEGLPGRQRSTGRRAARVSSRRASRVECGASRTRAGSRRASSAIAGMASANWSSVSLVSVSVRSIMRAAFTTRGEEMGGARSEE